MCEVIHLPPLPHSPPTRLPCLFPNREHNSVSRDSRVQSPELEGCDVKLQDCLVWLPEASISESHLHSDMLHFRSQALTAAEFRVYCPVSRFARVMAPK